MIESLGARRRAFALAARLYRSPTARAFYGGSPNCRGVQNLLSSQPSARVTWDLWAAGALHSLAVMAAPRTVWRITLQDGSVVHCVLWERKPGTAVVWYRDDWVEGVEEFVDPVEAEDGAAEPRDEVTDDCQVRGHPPRQPPGSQASNSVSPRWSRQAIVNVCSCARCVG